MDEQNKQKSKSKEYVMIALVVVLAFGLTVAGIVYLTKFLIGNDKTEVVSTPPAAVEEHQEENNSVVLFSSDNETPPEVEPPAEPTTTPAQERPTPAPQPVPSAPVATKPSAPTPTPAPATGHPATIPSSSPTAGKYQVQLYAFRSQATAEKEAKKLVQTYPDVFVMKADLGASGIWYRVRCCSTDSQDQAAKTKAEIEKKYKITPYIVNR